MFSIFHTSTLPRTESSFFFLFPRAYEIFRLSVLYVSLTAASSLMKISGSTKDIRSYTDAISFLDGVR